MRPKGKVLILDDDELIVSMLSRALKKEGYEVTALTKPNNVAQVVRSLSPEIFLLDVTLPERSGLEILEELREKGIDRQVVMLTADDSAETAVKAMKLGAADYLTKPFNIDEVKIVIGSLMEKERLRQEVDCLRKLSAELFDKELIGESAAIRDLKEKIQKLGDARVRTILITGESGTGKELVARHIHQLMHPEEGGYTPFVTVNCTALPDSLIESEFFGFEKGSFTDAKAQKKGMFELANGGTLLLDEIGDMKRELQGKLLRVLEERATRRIGGKEAIPVDVTVLAATNRSLSEAVERGEFRMDLYYRLNAFSLHMPALRERKEDIPRLAEHFLGHFTVKYNKKNPARFSPEAEEILLSYGWPGNVRELKNVIERIAVMESAEVIMPAHLPAEIVSHSGAKNVSGEYDFRSGFALDDVEKDLIRQALLKTGYNKTHAAKLLDISYDALRYRMKKFGLEPEE